MKNKISIRLSLIIIFIGLTNQIFFILDPFEKRCISRDLVEKNIFSGVFFISGEQEDKNKAIIIDSNKQVIWEANYQKHGSFNLEIKHAGTYSLCIETTANVQLTVSFEFYDEKKDEQLISVQNIENLNTVIHTIRRKLDIIHANMRNSAVRRGAHLEVSTTINSKITFYTVIKIVFLVIFSIFQIMMLTSIFGNVKVLSKISVEGHMPVSNNPNISVGSRDTIFL